LREVEDRVNLRVEDDGRGVDVVTSGRRDEGFGLRSIRERAAVGGGSAELRQLEASGGSVLDVVLT
jgi:signal transduction histidine kinase